MKSHALAALLLIVGNVAWAEPKAAIFPFELVDNSLEGELGGQRPDQVRRLALVTDELRRLAGDAGYESVDLSGLDAEIAKIAPLHKCDGCEVDLARRAGADVAIAVTVRKTSNLILGFTIVVREVATGRIVRAVQADIRGNTDESWLRGIRWLVANRLRAQPPQ